MRGKKNHGGYNSPTSTSITNRVNDLIFSNVFNCSNGSNGLNGSIGVNELNGLN